jgi:hypothetical protein
MALSLLPFYSMAELGWSMPEVAQEHLPNLVSLGYMTKAELATCRVPEYPMSPVLVGGYIMAFYNIPCYSSMAWSFITSLPRGSYI